MGDSNKNSHKKYRREANLVLIGLHKALGVTIK